MSKQPTIKVEGLADLSKALRKLTDKEIPKGLQRLNKELAVRIASKAATKVPVRSGKLKRSVKGLGQQRGAAIKMGTAKLPYAGWIEFGGTINFATRDTTRDRPFVKEGRYLYPTVDAERAHIAREFETEIQKLLNKL